MHVTLHQDCVLNGKQANLQWITSNVTSQRSIRCMVYGLIGLQKGAQHLPDCRIIVTCVPFHRGIGACRLLQFQSTLYQKINILVLTRLVSFFCGCIICSRKMGAALPQWKRSIQHPGFDSQKHSSRQPRLSHAQYSFIVQKCGLKTQFNHS